MKKKIPCAAALSYDINWIKLDEDMPLYENAEKYLCVKISCLTSRRVDHNLQQELAEATAYLTAVQGAALFEHASAGEPEAMLEMAVRSVLLLELWLLSPLHYPCRYLSGCGTRKASNEGALYVLDALVDASCELAKARGVGVISRPLMAQAHSCAAQAHFHKFMASPAERAAMEADERSYSRPETLRLGVGRSPLEYFLLAAHHANESIKLGLDSPIVLSVGMKIRQIGEVLGVDVQLTVTRGKLFRPLWCAVSRRYEELYEEERSRARKTNRNPNEYVCAAEGCGIGGERRAALLECSGRCPRDLKPHYCSKQCQKRVSSVAMFLIFKIKPEYATGLANAQAHLQAEVG